MDRLSLVFISLLGASLTNVCAATEGSFELYLDKLKQDAATQGIDQLVLDKAFSQIKLFKKASNDDKTAPELPKDLEHYIPKAISEEMVVKGRVLAEEYRPLLVKLGKQYRVQPRFILALWGLESDFGNQQGGYPVLSVTASLAYEGQEVYRDEFFAALKILASQSLDFNELKGSSTGAMGPLGLRPSAYLQYGSDGDGDGKIDIWNSFADGLASVANYLQQTGWDDTQTWGRQVKAPESIENSQLGVDYQASFSHWQQLGVRRYDGGDLPGRTDMQVSLIMPDGVTGRHYLVYQNYRALRSWQNSDYFALAAAYLSERIKYPPRK
ncbi:TPA: lytic murein transglycosylase [Shewanella algae]|uniref:lytic murein transglycosylase n=1 Tax=Shewanella algae TaxID=38313 RepID=UPI001AAEF42F|nr:lytic murein transglycosylase [Shewanella algae]MBO2637377.1 lytic murein transglycosylase [Shewanella algae]HDS1203266.1 lytic murein transglycosylase [Shewanella algae]